MKDTAVHVNYEGKICLEKLTRKRDWPLQGGKKAITKPRGTPARHRVGE